MLANSRSDSVTGRTRMLDRNSSGISRGRMTHGTPLGIVCNLR